MTLEEYTGTYYPEPCPECGRVDATEQPLQPDDDLCPTCGNPLEADTLEPCHVIRLATLPF